MQRRELHAECECFGRKLVLRQDVRAARGGSDSALAVIQVERDAAPADQVARVSGICDVVLVVVGSAEVDRGVAGGPDSGPVLAGES